MNSWMFYALLSATAAGATAVLAKVGVQGVPSNLATAIRTAVVLVFAWGIVLARNESSGLRDLKALQLAPASRVAAIDKLSLPITVILAWLALGEPVSLRLWIGISLMVAGAAVTVGS